MSRISRWGTALTALRAATGRPPRTATATYRILDVIHPYRAHHLLAWETRQTVTITFDSQGNLRHRLDQRRDGAVAARRGARASLPAMHLSSPRLRARFSAQIRYHSQEPAGHSVETAESMIVSQVEDRCIRKARVPRTTVHGTRKTCGSLLATPGHAPAARRCRSCGTA